MRQLRMSMNWWQTLLRRRSEELVADGYVVQVLVGEDYFPLFWQDENERKCLAKTEQGTFRTKDGSREFTLNELARSRRLSQDDLARV